MRSQVLHTVWCYISGEAAGKFELDHSQGSSLKMTQETWNMAGGSSGIILLHSKFIFLKACLHMRFLMRFLVRFHVQNAPYPTLHEYFFREASCGWERKLSHIISRHPSFQFLLTWRYFVPQLRDYKPVRGRLWQVLFTKSHEKSHV